MKEVIAKLNKFYFFHIVVIFFFLAFTIHPHTDPDLGWHLRYGEYFFKTGHVLKDNILSFVWPNYKWVQASWGYDLLVYQVFNTFGFLGLALGAGFFSLAIFLIATWPIKRFNFFQFLFLASVFISQTPPLSFSGMRTQTPSSVFFIIVIIIGIKTLQNNHNNSFLENKAFFLLPVIFIFWANMHGGFALGLGLLCLMWAVEGGLMLFKKIIHAKYTTTPYKKWLVFGLFIFFSFITPLLNPWGTQIYKESFEHSSNRNLNYITEWRPMYVDYPQDAIVSLILVVMALSIFLFRRKIGDLPFIIVLIFTSYLGFSAVRFSVNMGILLTYYFAQNILLLNLALLKKTFIRILLPTILVSLLLTDIFVTNLYFIFIPPSYTLNYNWDTYCKSRYLYLCDENITKIMRATPPKGNGFVPVNSAGYLEWRVPGVKAFIDGRMVAWEENGQTPPISQADDVYLDRSPVSFIKFDSQYHFNWLIIPSNAGVTKYLDALVKKGEWEKVYHGDFYSYYVKSQK